MKNARIFYADLQNARTVTVNAPGNKQDLIAQLYEGLAPVSEAGKNWDALDEVLRDLSWIGEKDIVLVHAGLDSLPAEDSVIYADLLAGAAAWWKNKRRHRLFIIAPGTMKDAFDA